LWVIWYHWFGYGGAGWGWEGKWWRLDCDKISTLFITDGKLNIKYYFIIC
jgi:hypothetical protein